MYARIVTYSVDFQWPGHLGDVDWNGRPLFDTGFRFFLINYRAQNGSC